MKEIQIKQTIYEPGDVMKAEQIECVVIKTKMGKNGNVSYLCMFQNGRKVMKTAADVNGWEYIRHSEEFAEFFSVEEEEKPERKKSGGNWVVKDKKTGKFLAETDEVDTSFEFTADDVKEARRMTKQEAANIAKENGNRIICCLTV